LGSWSSWLVAALVTPALKRGLKPVGLDITSSVAVVAASSDADGSSATLFSCTDSALGSSFSSSFLGRFAALNLGVKPLGLGASMEASSFASGADSSLASLSTFFCCFVSINLVVKPIGYGG